MNKILRKNNGITLIALVITIVILIILSVVTFNVILGEDGLIRRAQEAKALTEEASKSEEQTLSDLEDYLEGFTEGSSDFDKSTGVNKPKLKEGMIPVYYDSTSKVWKKADENNADKSWYDYDNKQWANIVTVSEENKDLREAAVGTEIPMEDITTFFVWIPRYAYSITSGYKQGNNATGKISVTFLQGTTNVGSDNTTYPTDYDASSLSEGATTPKIVHPAFNQNGNALTGIWVAKFEASGTNSSDAAVGNSGSTSYSPVQPDDTTYVKILPNKISWRAITIGDSQYRSTQMSNDTDKYGWTNVNSHLIKNSEWGAVAYLCYSDYGTVPMTNGAGSYNSTGKYYYNLYTGAGPKSSSDEGRYENWSEETNGYNTELGVLSSTTGNVYGVYDMAGGAWERVAAYLDNGNDNIDKYGNSTSVTYFEDGQLKSEYANLWEVYEVSEEEKSDQIKVGSETITQNALWNWSRKSVDDNTARQRLVAANFSNMSKFKGIGLETAASTEFSYYAPYGTNSSDQNWNWFKTVKDTSTNTTAELARTWNGDYVLIGHAARPFVGRGGDCSDGSGAGVLNSDATDGYANYYGGFRPVLAF